MKIFRGNSINKRGWCWINGMALILYLDPKIIFQSIPEIEPLRELSDIMRKDILHIIYN